MFKIGQWIQGPSEAVKHWRFKRKAIIGRILEVKESGYLVVEDAWSYKWTVDGSKVFTRKKPNTQKKPFLRKWMKGGEYHRIEDIVKDAYNKKMLWWTKIDRDTGEVVRGHPMAGGAIMQISIRKIVEHWKKGSISKAVRNPTRKITVNTETKEEVKKEDESF